MQPMTPELCDWFYTNITKRRAEVLLAMGSRWIGAKKLQRKANLPPIPTFLALVETPIPRRLRICK